MTVTTTFATTETVAPFVVNGLTTGDQFGPEVVVKSDGSSVIFYGDTPTGSIYFRTLSADGTVLGPETLLMNFAGSIYYGTVSAVLLSNGNIAVTWEHEGSYYGETDISFRIFDSSMNALTPIRDASVSVEDNYYPVIAASANGGFVVAWEDYINSGSSINNADICFRRFDALGNSTDLESGIRVNANLAYDERPSVTVLTDGKIVLAYDRIGGGGTPDGPSYPRVAWQAIYNADGTVFKSSAPVDSVGSTNRDFAVTALSNGGYVVAYTDNEYGSDQLTSAVFNSAGVELSHSLLGISFSTPVVTSSVRNSSGLVAISYSSSTGAGIELLASDGSVLATNLSLSAQSAGWVGGSHMLASAMSYTSGVAGDGSGFSVAASIYEIRRTTTGDAANDVITLTSDELNDTVNAGDGNDTINAGGGSNIVNAGAGNDTVRSSNNILWVQTLDGGAGVDTLDVSGSGVQATINLTTGVTNLNSQAVNFENATTGAGDDTVIGTASDNILSGNGGIDYLIGGGGNDQLRGGTGSNTLQGGTGDDLYYLSSGSDSVIELPGEGYDTAQPSTTSYTLPANVEALMGSDIVSAIFTGVGNALDNAMTGGKSSADQLLGLDGNDYLNGEKGPANTLIGGLGNDVYEVKAVGDSTVELAGQGVDEVRTTFGIYGLQANIENLTFTDNLTHGAGVGNVLNNVLTGGTGVDSLFGREGNDSLHGGTGSANTLLGQQGDDIYFNEAAGDTVIEMPGEGIDTVMTAFASFTLRSNVENLTYTGLATFTGIGSLDANTMTGGAGADFLDGKDGNDILIGGSGNDILIGGNGADQFRYAGGETGLDRVLDFVSGTDKIALSSTGFAHTTTVNFIQSGAPVATSTNSTFLYNVNNGIVSYDADGTGAGAAVQIAQLNAGLSLAATDFLFY